MFTIKLLNRTLINNIRDGLPSVLAVGKAKSFNLELVFAVKSTLLKNFLDLIYILFGLFGVCVKVDINRLGDIKILGRSICFLPRRSTST